MIRFNAPDFKLGGTITGERTIEGVGSIVFEDLANQLRGVVTLGTFKSSGFFSGFTGTSSDAVQMILPRHRQRSDGWNNSDSSG